MKHSESIAALAGALAKAQTSFGAVIKEKSVNAGAQRYKYADLAAVCEAVLPALSANEIAVVQGGNGTPGMMETILAHSSGEWISTITPIFEGRNGGAQGYGSGATYARRYGLLAACGVAPEDDDDGAKASGKDAVHRGAEPGAGWQGRARDDAVNDAGTPTERATKARDMIVADFNGVKRLDTLNAHWENWQKHIDRLESNYPALHGDVLDAYERRRNEIMAPEGAE